MRDIIFILVYLMVILSPFAIIGWIIYRMVKGSKGDDYSIK